VAHYHLAPTFAKQTILTTFFANATPKQIAQNDEQTRRVEVTIPGVNKSGIACEKIISTVRYTYNNT